MEEMFAHCLPWQLSIVERALDLQSNGHLPHAILIDTASDQDISGFARYLAMSLLCDDSSGTSPCDRCEACRMMRAGTYADFGLVTLEWNDKTKKINKNINIEQIRKLIHEVSLTHQYDRLKIAVIYPAETMNQASANALLKTLEEPAPGVLIVLLTHNRGRVPVTLRSRCQSWSIARPSPAQARDWLRGQGFAEDDAETYLEYAAGDPVLAHYLRQQDYASLVEKFKSQLSRFLRGDLAAAGLGQELRSLENGILRRLIAMTLNAFCYQTSGLDAAANPKSGADRKRAQQLLDLRQRAQFQLQVEENNLDLQLQLEDVLISLKQILTRRSI